MPRRTEGAMTDDILNSRGIVALGRAAATVLALGGQADGRAAGPDVKVLVPYDGSRIGISRPASITGVASPGISGSPVAKVEVRYEGPGGYDSGYILAKHHQGLWSADVGPVPRGQGRLT